MASVLTPRLTSLDERVLNEVPRSRGRRASQIAARVFGNPWWRCDTCGHEEREQWWGGGRLQWLNHKPKVCVTCSRAVGWRSREITLCPLLKCSPEQVTETRQILRGLERVGLVTQHGGWWKRL